MSGKPTPDIYEIDAVNKDGRIIPVEINAKTIDINGSLCDMVVLRDISERKRAEASLKEQKELIDSILSSTPISILVIDKDQQIIMANQTFADTFNLDISNSEGQNISSIPALNNLIPEITNFINKQLSTCFTEFQSDEKGRLLLLRVSLTRMPKDNLLLIFDDVTAERDKQEKSHLADRLASVGEMVSGIAHELNNPLTSITLLSQMLVKDNTPEEDKEDLLTIHNEAKRAASIIMNLLTFASKRGAERHPAQINRILDDVLKLRAHEHKLNNIHVNKRLEMDLPEVPIDHLQILQVFLNLILNAEQAMIDSHKRGTLTIITEKDDGSIKVSIKDDGPGINEDNMRKIFTPFYTTKEVGKGTGLGLSEVVPKIQTGG